MTDLLFTQAALAALSRSPWVVVPEALEAGRLDEATESALRLEEGCRSQIERYSGWLASLYEFYGDQWGRSGATDAVRITRAFFANSPDVAFVDEKDPAPIGEAIFAAARHKDTDVAIAHFNGTVASWRHSIDLHRDWISALLSAVYRDHGPDCLETALRYCGATGLIGGIEQHIQNSPEERLVSLVNLLHGHFAELTVAEDARKFVITQNLCGTCSRQIIDGRLGPPLNLALVTEPHAVTWGRGDTTIYRTHIPIWHVAMAKERIGAPWPVNLCPEGLNADACRILLYKNPYDPEAESQVPGTRWHANRGASLQREGT